MKLLEQGKIATLDTPVVCLLKSVRLSGRFASNVTLRHLLTHTAGLETFRSVGDFLSDTHGLGLPASKQIPTLAEFYGRNGLCVERVPGTTWMYSNHGYALLGQIIEGISNLWFGLRVAVLT
jgi:CubicO group peptidase (beta-lactamase class C family)